MLTLGKYSIGVGDRFARQAGAQLRACLKAAERGVEVIPVWNKSNREHITIGSEPSSVRAAADVAVRELKWDKPYHVDADHVRLETVDPFIPHSDFFTIDVADFIGRPAEASAARLRFRAGKWSASPTNFFPPYSKPGASTAASRRPKAEANSSPRFPW